MMKGADSHFSRGIQVLGKTWQKFSKGEGLEGGLCQGREGTGTKRGRGVCVCVCVKVCVVTFVV